MMETQTGYLASKMDTNQARMEESWKEEMRLTDGGHSPLHSV
jgi:hypothetical protein